MEGLNATGLMINLNELNFMAEAFIDYITQQAALTQHEIELLKSVGFTRSLKKKQFFIKEGDTCRQAAFVIKGLVRIYRVADDGSEHTLCFSPERWWATDWESYVEQVPSGANIVALEDCELLVWTKEDFDRLLRDIPAMNAFFQKFVSDRLKASLARIYMYISQSSEQKYEYFVKTSPDLQGRVPLHMIASYLGVTRETLSRVRSNFAHR
ncbi:Crp/Fnr family transcriptional regulator [Mucilaginibacter roseus]|uniref:Crp/Fnr family transcriptional regulator n=1 Tax=Mucilaginibacter roseus TaxID=1528868 RepID=A0ABS8TVW4_9SPHI|nr:Crp/Fnr family transcriptional regulator [Mucilaginibacter roseus]MCD8739015.1 Crp/Fnr family transcriptional regulator [Mucilaginibacter roseus]